MKNFSVLLMIALLAACSSGEPSDSDVQEAVGRVLTIASASSDNEVERLLSVKKKSCTPIVEKMTYKCEVSVEAEVNGKKEVDSDTITFTKQENKWKILIDGRAF